MPSNIKATTRSDPFHEYTIYRNSMLTADLVEFASYTPLGWIIRKGTGRKVNHSAFLWRIDQYSGIKDRLFLLEALNAGLEWNSLSQRIHNFRGQVYWSSLIVNDKQRERMLALAVEAATKIRREKRYDYLSLIRNAYRKVNINPKYWFCSEFYHYLLIAIGLLPKGEKARRPGEFHELPIFVERKLIYDSNWGEDDGDGRS